MKMYKKKECEDCSWKMYYEVNIKILEELRDVLGVPDNKDIIHHATKLMRERK